MAALNGGLGSGGLSNGTGSTMEALTQAYSGIQQYAAAALPTLYNQSLLTQQSIGAAGSQKEGMQKVVETTWKGFSKGQAQPLQLPYLQTFYLVAFFRILQLLKIKKENLWGLYVKGCPK